MNTGRFAIFVMTFIIAAIAIDYRFSDSLSALWVLLLAIGAPLSIVSIALLFNLEL